VRIVSLVAVTILAGCAAALFLSRVQKEEGPPQDELSLPHFWVTTVNGGDFAYESTVGLHLDTATGTPVQTAVTDRGGFFQTQLVLPKGTSAGPHTVIAVGTGGRKATAVLHVR